ncbi:MAG: acyl-CoA reductase [Bacteroidales bacterium]|nr:acyl-CoA reductase [Bacteroidales bacterium]
MPETELFDAFNKLGKVLGAAAGRAVDISIDNQIWVDEFADLIQEAKHQNPWFVPDFVKARFLSISDMLESEKLSNWMNNYAIPVKKPQTVLVVMAGNIPAVGFHDMLCVLVSGNRLLAKLSSDDGMLLPAMGRFLSENCPTLHDRISFTSERVSGFDAVIATGSNNTSRYFEYYFGRYPHIIRRNRNSMAILTGSESDEELKGIADDILLYFGRGCRSVSHLMVPAGYDFMNLFKAMNTFDWIRHHSKYINNYDYQKAMVLVNSLAHFDSGYLIFRPERQLMAAISVINYTEYTTLDESIAFVKENTDALQCVVTSADVEVASVKPGQAQQAGLWDYSDAIDTMEFLLNMKK